VTKHKFCGTLGHTSFDSGLIYMRARYMDPALGRFISEDPACSGNNWYAYCGNNPVNFIDLMTEVFNSGGKEIDNATGLASSL
jgi:RHS repeat-associated protein